MGAQRPPRSAARNYLGPLARTPAGRQSQARALWARSRLSVSRALPFLIRYDRMIRFHELHPLSHARPQEPSLVRCLQPKVPLWWRRLGVDTERELRIRAPPHRRPMLSRVAQAFGLGGPAKDARWIARLADVTAGAVASKPALSLPPDAPLSKALKMMHAHGVGALHVTEMDGPLQVLLAATQPSSATRRSPCRFRTSPHEPP